jgi:hypothetical protein
MTKPHATPRQMMMNKLSNRTAIRCAICDGYISPFTGLPVILDDTERLVEFADPDCCVQVELAMT